MTIQHDLSSKIKQLVTSKSKLILSIAYLLALIDLPIHALAEDAISSHEDEVHGDSNFNFNIPQKLLEDALTTLIEQSGMTILFLSDDVKNISAPALRGRYTIQNALDLLLIDTKLEFKEIAGSDRTFVVKKKHQDKSAAQSQQSNEKTIADNRMLNQPITLAEVVVVGETNNFGDRFTPSTATKSYVPTADVPQSLEGIGWELFHDRGNCTLAEAFQAYSSINITDSRGNINLRGFPLRDHSIFKDGHPLVDRGVATMLLQNIEGIEVAKGVNSTLYGYGQPGGIINLVTKKPKIDPFTNLSISYGNQDSFIALDSNPEPLFEGNLPQRYNLIVKQDRDNDRTAGQIDYLQFTPSYRYLIDDISSVDLSFTFDQQKLNGNLGRRPYDFSTSAQDFGKPDALSVAYPQLSFEQSQFYPSNGADFDSPQAAKIFDFHTIFDTTTKNNWGVKVGFYAGKSFTDRDYMHDLYLLANTYFDPQSQLILNQVYSIPLSLGNTSAQENFEEYLGIANPISTIFANPPSLPYWTDNKVHFYQLKIRNEGESHQYNFTLDVDKQFEWGSSVHHALFGTTISKNRSRQLLFTGYNQQLFQYGEQLGENSIGWALQRYSHLSWFDPFGENTPAEVQLPDKIALAAGLEPATLYPFDNEILILHEEVKIDSASFYLQDQIDLNQHWKFRLAAGLNHFSADKKLRVLNGLALLTGDNLMLLEKNSPQETLVSPTIGLVFQPIENVSLYMSYGKQMNISYGLTADNDDFEAEKTLGLETGIKWWISDLVNFGVNIYSLEQENWSLNDSANAGYSSQDGKFRTQGAEYSLNGFITPHFKIAANYSHMEAELLEGGANAGFEELRFRTSLTGIPNSSGSFWLQYHEIPLSKNGWIFGGGVSYLGKRQNDYELIDIPIDSYKVFDLAATYQNEDFRVALNIDNVTNRDWIVGESQKPNFIQAVLYLYEGYGRRFRLSTDLFF